MTITRNIPPTLQTPEMAELLAQQLTAEDEDGWTYQAKHDPNGTGGSFIMILDETNTVVGHL